MSGFITKCFTCGEKLTLRQATVIPKYRAFINKDGFAFDEGETITEDEVVYCEACNTESDLMWGEYAILTIVFMNTIRIYAELVFESYTHGDDGVREIGLVAEHSYEYEVLPSQMMTYADTLTWEHMQLIGATDSHIHNLTTQETMAEDIDLVVKVLKEIKREMKAGFFGDRVRIEK